VAARPRCTSIDSGSGGDKGKAYYLNGLSVAKFTVSASTMFATANLDSRVAHAKIDPTDVCHLS
jgi:hypothetical protein